MVPTLIVLCGLKVGFCFLFSCSGAAANTSTNASAFARGREVDFFTAARTAALAATGHFIDGGPGPAFGFAHAGTALFIAVLDVRGLALLFGGVTPFISAWHGKIL